MDLEDNNFDEIIPSNYVQEKKKKRKKLLSPSKLQRQIENNSHPTPKWVVATNGRIPTGAFIGAYDTSGQPIYIARAYHEGLLHPASLVASARGCTARVYTKYHFKNEYQVLIDGHYNWVRTYRYDPIPPNAIICGQTDYDQVLHIVRLKLKDGSLRIPLFMWSNKWWKVKSSRCNEKCGETYMDYRESEFTYFDILCYGTNK